MRSPPVAISASVLLLLLLLVAVQAAPKVTPVVMLTKPKPLQLPDAAVPSFTPDVVKSSGPAAPGRAQLPSSSPAFQAATTLFPFENDTLDAADFFFNCCDCCPPAGAPQGLPGEPGPPGANQNRVICSCTRWLCTAYLTMSQDFVSFILLLKCVAVEC